MSNSTQPSYQALIKELDAQKARVEIAEGQRRSVEQSASYLVGDLMAIIGRLPEGEVADEMEAAIYRYHKRIE